MQQSSAKRHLGLLMETAHIGAITLKPVTV